MLVFLKCKPFGRKLGVMGKGGDEGARATMAPMATDLFLNIVKLKIAKGEPTTHHKIQKLKREALPVH